MSPSFTRARSLLGRARGRTPVPDPGIGALTDLVDRLVPDGPARVALLCRKKGAVGRHLARRHPDVVVEVLPAKVRGSARHVRLTAAGPFDLIVDTAGPAGRLKRFEDAFYQLRTGGAYVVRDGATASGSSAGSGRLGRLLAAALASQGSPVVVPSKKVSLKDVDIHALGRSVESVAVSDRHLVVTSKAVGALAKLREGELDSYLARTGDARYRTVDTVPAITFTSRCTLRENSEVREGHQREECRAPAVSLREYHQVDVSPGQVISDERVLFPDTFRHNQRSRIRNSFTMELAPRFASLPLDHDPEPPPLAGTFYHLDNEVRGHFGHLMTEQVSRLWAYPQAKRLAPDLKLLIGTNKRAEVQPWEYTVYSAAGIDPEDVVLIREPRRVERLLSASPMLSNPDFVHPDIVDTWGRIGDALVADAVGGPRPTRIFCSRRISKRSCNNTEEVEALFREQGFEVVFPEEYSLGDQVEMFRAAEVVAGFAGSGLFNLCFVERPTPVIMISSEAYTARNEYLFASLRGHDISSVKSAPDHRGFQSPFTFDHEREGRFLAEVFASLD